jgi:drug/metabolite transporter superfamily protein YnfA
MQCWNHEGKSAVGTCVVCNKNYCKSCFEFTTGGDPLICPRCLNENNKEYLAGLEKRKTEGKTFLIISAIAYVIGLLIFALSGDNESGPRIVGLACMGIPAIPMALRFSFWVDDHNPERYETDGTTIRKGLNNMGCGSQILLAGIVVLLGIAITPILMLITCFKISKTGEKIEEARSRVCSDEGLKQILARLE